MRPTLKQKITDALMDNGCSVTHDGIDAVYNLLTSTPDGSHGLREALERILKHAKSFPDNDPFVATVYTIATEALKK